MRLRALITKHSFFAIVILLGFVSLISVYARYQDLAQKNRQIENRMEQLVDENRVLIDRQDRLLNDPVFAESVARDRLKVAQEGEVIYKILPEE